MEKAKQYFCAKPNGKLHYPHTILTGFGFLASSIAWAIYDPYITKILNHLLNNSATITSWSAKLNAAFPALAEFAAANGEDVTTAAGGITLVPLFIGIIMTFDNIFGVIFQPTFGKLSDSCRAGRKKQPGGRRRVSRWLTDSGTDKRLAQPPADEIRCCLAH